MPGLYEMSSGRGTVREKTRPPCRLYLYLFIGGVFVFRPKTAVRPRCRRPPRAPLRARRGRQAGGMSARGGRALEPSTSTSWLTRTARRRSEQAYEVDAVMGTGEWTGRYQSTAWARRRPPSMPEGTGVNSSPILRHYNSFLGGVDRHDVLVVPLRRSRPEDVLR